MVFLTVLLTPSLISVTRNMGIQAYGTSLTLSPELMWSGLRLRGEKRIESEGTAIDLTDALVFKTEPKKNENFKFSFE